MKCNSQTVIDVALSQVGYKEKASNNQLDDPNANAGSNNWNKYARDIDENYPDFYNGKKNGYDWCDIFVDWCFIQAYGRENAQKLLCQPNNSCGAGCEYSYRYYKDKGQVGSSPKKGAQIFFGDLDHTGIVVDFDTDYIWTVEGNSGNEVKNKRYSRNDSWIYGYGYPKFDEEVPTPTPAPSNNSGDKWTGKYPKLPKRGYFLTGDGYSTNKNMKPDIKLIQQYLNWAIDAGLEVDGQYGPVTTDRVADFQKIVGFTGNDIDGSYGKKTLDAAKAFRKESLKPIDNTPEKKEIKASNPAEKYDAKIARTYSVNAKSGLNIRDGAGTDYKILVSIPYGTEVQNYGYYSEAQGLKWFYVAFEYNNVRYIGFASAQWLS